MMDAVKDVVEQTQYLTFALAGEEYAISILKVKEIIEYDAALTKVPNMPPSVRGVINLRGSVVPVVDLALKFGLPERPVTKRTCVVIVEAGVGGDHTVMGVVTDTVSEVMGLSPRDIEAPPPFGTPVRGDYLKGLGKIGKKFVLILDIDRVLSAEDLPEAAEVPSPEAGRSQGSGTTPSF